MVCGGCAAFLSGYEGRRLCSRGGPHLFAAAMRRFESYGLSDSPQRAPGIMSAQESRRMCRFSGVAEVAGVRVGQALSSEPCHCASSPHALCVRITSAGLTIRQLQHAPGHSCMGRRHCARRLQKWLPRARHALQCDAMRCDLLLRQPGKARQGKASDADELTSRTYGL